MSVNSLFGQDKNSLTENKLRIEKEIDYTNKLLEETRKSKDASLNQLVILKNKIANRESLIQNINLEIESLEASILETEKQIKERQNELKRLKEEYADLIYFAYKNRNAYDRLMFIFSSQDFNQAYRRLKYLQQYSSYRKTQASLIKAAQADLNTKLQLLENQKLQKIQLARDKENEVLKLVSEREEKDRTLNNLSKKEKELKATIKRKEKEAARLQEEIERIIAEEMRAAAARAREDSKSSTNTDVGLTAADLELSNDFAANKGRLPWPSKNGIISGTFGEHRHPVLRKVKTKNNGINILTDQGELARSVFDGEVVSVKTITANNKAVIIRHGDYFSVYSNLIEIYVKRGDKVNIMQSIGRIFTDSHENKTEMHFEIWKGKSLLNPSSWLTKQI